MKTKSLSRTAAWLVLAASATLGQIKGATLKVGDAAPKLQVSKWVQGEPVQGFARDKAYIVEFWATWCGPCRVSIPHLNDIQTKFKDKGLIVIGQDVYERDLSAVAPFVKKMGDKMTYRVALDTVAGGEKGKGKMAETWMEAAGQNGIPTAFVVEKRGRIAWIGHPMQLDEKILDQVLDGSYDLKKAAADYDQRQKNQEQLRALSAELNGSVQKKDWDNAESTLNTIEKLLPEDERNSVGMKRFQIRLDRKDYPGAYKLADQLSDAHKDKPMMQNEIAWEIATKEGVEKRDLILAEKIARAANETTHGENAEILDTLARVLFMKGDRSAAVPLQEKAVQRAEGNRKKQFQTTLDGYKEGKLPKVY